jgi:hypothetical protein
VQLGRVEVDRGGAVVARRGRSSRLWPVAIRVSPVNEPESRASNLFPIEMSRPRREMPPAPSPSRRIETYSVTRAQDAPAITQCAEREERTVEGGRDERPARGSLRCVRSSRCAARTSRDSVQAVVLPGRHWRPVTSPMTQLGGPVEYPSLPPWCTYHDEPSCLTTSPVETRPRSPSRRSPDSWQVEWRWDRRLDCPDTGRPPRRWR